MGQWDIPAWRILDVQGIARKVAMPAPEIGNMLGVFMLALAPMAHEDFQCQHFDFLKVGAVRSEEMIAAMNCRVHFILYFI